MSTPSMVYKGHCQMPVTLFGPRSGKKKNGPYWLALIKVSLVNHTACM